MVKGKEKRKGRRSLARIQDIKNLLTKTRGLVRASDIQNKIKSDKSKKVTVYKRIAVPGTSQYVTIQTKDLRDYVNIFYNKKRFNIKTRDLTNMKTIPEIIGKIRTYSVA